MLGDGLLGDPVRVELSFDGFAGDGLGRFVRPP
jgi:hypothetical protein